MAETGAPRVAAITGASSGIGEATARVLVASGWNVALGARRADRLQALAEELGGDERAKAFGVDVGDEEAANDFVRGAHEHFGRLDALVNNAGVMLLGAVTGADTNEWRRMIDVNLLGLLYCTHAALPIFQAQGSGHVVNVSSVAGRVATLGSAVYNLTKWGVGAFSEALRQEVLNYGVRVTIIEPGAVATELLSHNNEMVQKIAAERFQGVTPLQAEDIADTIRYALEAPPNVSVNELLIRPTRQAR